MKRIIYLLTFVGLFSALLLFIIIFAGLIFTLTKAGVDIIPAVFSVTWNPEHGSYGILPMVTASVLVALLSLIIAIPFGFGILWCISVYNNTYSFFLRNLLRFMSGIPTVVYGFCGLFILVPFMRELGAGNGFNILSVAVVLSILIIPTLVLTIDSAIYNLMSKPENIILAAGALGLGRDKSFLYIVLNACRRQIAAGIVLAFGRALGDTLIALMISGNAAIMPNGLFASIRVIPAHINLLTAVEINSNIEFTLFLSGFMLLLAAVSMSIFTRILQK